MPTPTRVTTAAERAHGPAASRPGHGPDLGHPLLTLQRTAGNQAVAQLVQRQADPGAPQHQGQGPGAVVQGTGDVSVYAGATMTAEATLREVYQRAAREVSLEARRMIASGTSVDDAARWATQARNELKVQIRAQGSPVTRGLAEARNMRRYGNKIGPTYDDLIREGKTPDDIIGSSGRSSTKVNRFAARMRLAGRLMIAIDVAIVTWEVYEAEEGDRLRTAVAGAGGVAGALGGGWAGAKAGAWIGGGIGALFGGVGAPVGAAIGGVVGGIGGAIVGGMAGRAGAEAVHDFVEELVTPTLDEQMGTIDAAEEAFIRGAA